MDSSVIPVDATPLQSRTVARPVVPAANTEALNPCLECGACCSYYRVSFYCGELAGENGGWVPLEFVSQLSPLRACMKGTEMGHNRCIALKGELGRPGVACSIYEHRPSPCREFESWLPDGSPNPECQTLRASVGLAALPARRVEPPSPITPIHPASPTTPDTPQDPNTPWAA